LLKIIFKSWHALPIGHATGLRTGVDFGSLGKI
jgi:hypothetical protein